MTTFNWNSRSDGKVDFTIKQDDEIYTIKLEDNSDANTLADVLENLDANIDENLNEDEDETDE
jgi:hypothetical protein